MIAIAFTAALLLPLSLAYTVAPSSTVPNQLLAWLTWGVVLLAFARRHGGAPASGLGVRQVCWFAVVVVATSLLGFAWGGMTGRAAPVGLLAPWVLSIVASFVVLMVARSSGDGALARASAADAMRRAVLITAALGAAVGALQVYAPQWTDGDFLATPPTPGRASGNLRQPNHLATLLLWGIVAATWAFDEAARCRRDAMSAGWLAAAPVLLGGVVLTASRTGAVGVLVLAVWGVVDRRLGRGTRALLALLPLLYALLWWGFDAVSAADAGAGGGFAGTARLHQPDISSNRFAIWANTLELIAQNPWTGVGVGEFNFAWTLTQFSRPRPLEFFDHTHNLPLQLIVELGIPLGALVIGLLLYALWRAFVSARDTPGDAGLAKRCAFVMLLLIGVHSLLEYPLWYAYFLFPTAFLWGLCLAPVGASAPAAPAAAGAAPPSRRRLRWPVVAGVLMIAGGLFAAWDYARVSRIFVASDDAPPLEERIRDGRRSVFFAHHADYAWATTSVAPPLEAFRRPTHFLLDTRLMIAWSKALAAHGDVDRARWVAARLAEFKRADAASFFAPCRAPAEPGTPRPFQCEPPERRYTFRDFR